MQRQRGGRGRAAESGRIVERVLARAAEAALLRVQALLEQILHAWGRGRESKPDGCVSSRERLVVGAGCQKRKEKCGVS